MPDAPLHLSTQTRDWLTDHPQARTLVRSVWDTLAELDQAGQHPGPLDALRRVLTPHQPTTTGRCHTCRRRAWHCRPFPCIVWHQIHGELLGLFTRAGHHQPAVRLRDGRCPGQDREGLGDQPE
jgi:hypothetical protein